MAGAMGGFLAGSIVAKMVLDKTGWNSSIQDVKKDTDTLASRVNNSGIAFKDLATKVATAGVIVVGTLGAMVKRAADYQGGLWELSQQTGVSVEDLSSFKLALETSGATLDSFAFGMKGLSGLMADAADKNPRAIKTFDDLGVSFQNADGSSRPMREVFLDIADKFAGMQDGAKKTALAVDIFGRSGMNMIPTLNLGRDGLDSWIKKAEELGLVVSTKAAMSADDFNDKLKTLQLTFDAATQKLAVSLLPMLTTFVEKVTEVVGKIGKWIEQNPELIRQLTETAFKAGALMVAVILLTNPIYAVAAAAAAAVVIFIQLQDAEDKAAQAAARFDEVQANQIVKLKTIADAAGLTRKEFAELADKYDKNYIALSLAIDKGKEGIELQKSAIEYGKKHKQVVDDEREALEKAAEAARIATLKKAGLLQVTQDLIPPVRDLAAEQKYLNLIFGEAPAKYNAVLPPLDNIRMNMLSLAMCYEPVIDGVKNIPLTTEIALTASEQAWLNFKQNVAQNIGDIVVDCLRIPKGLDDALGKLPPICEGIFKVIYKSFQEFISALIAKWITDLLTNTIIKKTAEAATTAAGSLATLGTATTTLAGTLSTFLTTIATGIASAITILATAIASAATILAAAAPALLIVGGIALALYAGFSLIGALLGGGGGGNSDITYWLKFITDSSRQTADWLRISYMGYVESWDGVFESSRFCLYELHGRLVETRDAVSYWGGAIVDAVKGIKGAQHGYVSMSNELVMVHGTPNIPEIILPEPIYERNLQMAAAMGGGQPGGRPIELYINGEPVKFPMKENMRKIMVDLVPYMTKNEQLKIHPRSVRAF